MSSTLKNKLIVYAQNNLNVLLIGSHGIGKTMSVKEIADNLNFKFKYFSASTLDFFSDLGGIPAPNKDTGTLEYYRPKDVETAEFIFFDELNRAHPRVLNAVLEIIQMKTINGYRLPNLRMVWAAINPPGEDYQVEELDQVLIDRFHCYVKMKAEINTEYLSTKMNLQVALMLKDWWENILDKEQQRILTPRRIEYLGTLIDKNISWHDCIPQGHTFPTEDLSRRIKILRHEEDDVIITKESILQHKEGFIKRLKEDASCAIPISNIMKKFSESEIVECRDVLEALPKELVMNVGSNKFALTKRNIIDTFIKEKIDLTKYPKISEAFRISNESI